MNNMITWPLLNHAECLEHNDIISLGKVTNNSVISYKGIQQDYSV